MSGKRRLSATGKWLLDSTGKAKVCTCCEECSCCDCYYRLTFSGGGGDLEACPDCVMPVPYQVELPAYDCTPDVANNDGIAGFYWDSGVQYLFIELAPSCDPLITYWYEVAVDDCPAAGTYELALVDTFPGGGPYACTGPITCVVEKQNCPACCPCENACWRWTISAVEPYVGDCPDCEGWNDPVVFTPPFASYGCIPMCPPEETDFGFPVSYCRNWDGTIGLRASLEVAPPCLDETCCPYYIHYSMSTPMPVDANGCPLDGTYILDLDPSHDGEPCNIPQISVQIQRIACCDGPTSPSTYYLSCDITYTEHYDPAGGMVDCDGNASGIPYCSDAGSVIDWPLAPLGACTWENGNNLDVDAPARPWSCYFLVIGVGNGSPNPISIVQSGDGWDLQIAGTNFISHLTGGLTPVGTYPDILVCSNDGYNASRLEITNIVVTA